MAKYFDMLMEDVRFREGLHACMNCGVCTGVCPAAEFYNYDPRQIVSIVQTRDEEAIERLLKSDTIWFCGECMSCRPRCPRGNTPGYVIQALRTLSQKLGFFVESEKGRQQLALKRTIGDNILRTGYCIVPKLVKPELHPEQGPYGNGPTTTTAKSMAVSRRFTSAKERVPCVGSMPNRSTKSTASSTKAAAPRCSRPSNATPTAKPAKWATNKAPTNAI